MDFLNFFQSDEFKAYRQAELSAGADIVGDILKGSQTPDYSKGAMDMLNKVLLTPTSLATGKKAAQYAAEMTGNDLKILKMKVLKRGIQAVDE